MPARADRWIAVRLVIVVAVLAASLFAGALPASAQVKLTFDKHPGIDFNRYVDGQDLFGLKAVVLNNSWHDPSILHDDLSMLTFQRMGIPAPRQAHVRLYVGAGIYGSALVRSRPVDTLTLTDGLQRIARVCTKPDVRAARHRIACCQ